ncbi:MAG TPA: zinc ABC transporter substrate-binding protein [Candidatus Eisenbacteria bacterium]|nr:zinc ABC transporter substrate-binding protein [Candidatus Eisenbacteria bacterium]
MLTRRAILAGSVAAAVGARTRAAAQDPSPAPPCPVARIALVAAANQYGSIAQQLGGRCAEVTSIISNPNTDPHEFQTDIAVARAYQRAELVVDNGLGYDDFSRKIVATLRRKPIVVTAGDVVGLKAGDNPHVWYDPQYIDRVAEALTEAFERLRPAAAAYFGAQARGFAESLRPYRSAIETIRRGFAGTPIGATESIFVYMARATGLALVTPPKFMAAVAEGAQPSVADMIAFHTQIEQRQIRVLVYNAQTVTNLTRELQERARAAGVPVVGISETLVPPTATFQAWQVRQLEAVRLALGGGAR